MTGSSCRDGPQGRPPALAEGRYLSHLVFRTGAVRDHRDQTRHRHGGCKRADIGNGGAGAADFAGAATADVRFQLLISVSLQDLFVLGLVFLLRKMPVDWAVLVKDSDAESVGLFSSAAEAGINDAIKAGAGIHLRAPTRSTPDKAMRGSSSSSLSFWRSRRSIRRTLNPRAVAKDSATLVLSWPKTSSCTRTDVPQLSSLMRSRS